MIPIFEESRRTPLTPHGGPPLELDSDFGTLEGDAYELVERRYGDRGLALTRERFNSRNEDGDIVCTARNGDRTVGTMSVRFDGVGGLHTDLLFEAELAEWRAAGIKLCEFGSLAVDRNAPESRALLAQIFHLGYLHAYRRARCQRLVIEVNPRHVAFYRRWLGLLPYTTARHNPRVNAPAVLMSIDFETIREQISLWAGRADRLSTARCLYPLFWDEATEASMLAKLP
ncbi:N-acyl amino acid synthase FeeM domain-containing protein [Roseateles sp.]|uniref:N-acyl amino acid synthase FeeM domain-containing protein n=1 Tax=Roseateles sp. TaxID=1971397 RepID=UPI0039E7A665